MRNHCVNLAPQYFREIRLCKPPTSTGCTVARGRDGANINEVSLFEYY